MADENTNNNQKIKGDDEGDNDTFLPTQSTPNPRPNAGYTQAQFEETYPRQPPPQPEAFSSRLRSQCACSAACAKDAVLQKLPFIQTMRDYKWKDWILNDIIAGISIGVIHIPQGMGFSLLTSLPAVYGLYSSLFPVVIYFFFGTSRHISMGTMAITSLMIAAIIDAQLLQLGITPGASTLAPGGPGNGTEEGVTFPYVTALVPTAVTMVDGFNETTTASIGDSFDEEAFRVDIATSVTLMMGLWQIVLSLLNMGVIATFMSMTFIGGFLTACAVYIVTSQVPSALGISIVRPAGTFSLPLTWYEIFRNLPNVNPADIIISIICLAFLLFIKEWVNIKFADRMKAPIPAELIVVIIAALISYFCALDDRFGVRIIGHIPKGLPVPRVPSMHNAQEYVVDSFLIAIISFVIAISMAKLMARKHGYAIDQNQEMFAIGVTYSISSFFQCFAGTQAPPRTLVQDSAGGKTQLASIFSSILVLLVCLLLAPAFQPLPKSVLASIIIVALLPLFKQFFELKNYWRVNKYDFFVWVVTWIVTVIFSITMGLVAGVAFSLLTVIFEAFIAPALLMQNVSGEIYRPDGVYSTAEKSSGNVCVIRFEAPLFFANLERFKAGLLEASGIDLKAAKERYQNLKVVHEVKGAEKQQNGENGAMKDAAEEDVCLKMDDDLFNPRKGNDTDADDDVKAMVLDCSSVSYIDLQGLMLLKMLSTDFKAAGIRLALAGCNENMLRKLEDSQFMESHADSVFVSVPDAVKNLS